MELLNGGSHYIQISSSDYRKNDSNLTGGAHSTHAGESILPFPQVLRQLLGIILSDDHYTEEAYCHFFFDEETKVVSSSKSSSVGQIRADAGQVLEDVGNCNQPDQHLEKAKDRCPLFGPSRDEDHPKGTKRNVRYPSEEDQDWDHNQSHTGCIENGEDF